MNICYIVGAGDFPYPFSPDESDLVIAADGGYDSLMRHGIRCDLLIGDLDSIEGAPSDVELLRFPVKKDETDSFLSYYEGKRRGFSEFHIYGGTGGRADHTVANMALLLHARLDGCRAFLFGSHNISTVIKNEAKIFEGEAEKHFSAFAIGGDAEGVTIKGLEYECENATLKESVPLAVSNRFIGKTAEISVARGSLLIMLER